MLKTLCMIVQRGKKDKQAVHCSTVSCHIVMELCCNYSWPNLPSPSLMFHWHACKLWHYNFLIKMKCAVVLVVSVKRSISIVQTVFVQSVWIEQMCPVWIQGRNVLITQYTKYSYFKQFKLHTYMVQLGCFYTVTSAIMSARNKQQWGIR